ncbi:ATP-dependent RNA helicase DBP6 [Yarrowia sp. B02]|nr:ATP-dependent RNA helicase DBP6 [Yarrowia sp. B02]
MFTGVRRFDPTQGGQASAVPFKKVQHEEEDTQSKTATEELPEVEYEEESEDSMDEEEVKKPVEVKPEEESEDENLTADQKRKKKQEAANLAKRAEEMALERKRKRAQHMGEEDSDSEDDLAPTKISINNKIKLAKGTIRAKGFEELPQTEIYEDKPAEETITRKTQLQTQPILRNATYVEIDDTGTFDEFELSKNMKKNLQTLGYSKAFSVQKAVIPWLLAQQKLIAPDRKPDLLVSASTGSGKTATYGIPIIEKLRDRVVPRIRAVVVLPTKPLVMQVREVLQKLSQGTPLQVVALGNDRSPKREKTMLEAADIVVAAPGRLVEQVKLNPQLFSYIDFLVVDEADRLLGQDYYDWASVLLSNQQKAQAGKTNLTEHYVRNMQTLIFSATLTANPEHIASMDIFNPGVFVVGSSDSYSIPKSLTEIVTHVSAAEKPLMLCELLVQRDISRGVVFTKSSETAARVARMMEIMDTDIFHKGWKIAAVSAETSAGHRRRSMKQFIDGKIDFLVCTDLVSRGIDFVVDNVINYDVPSGKREYVHRVGRTARAGRQGNAYTFLTGSGEAKWFKEIGEFVGRTQEVDATHISSGNNEEYQAALGKLEEEV